jgi:hypothetical protein
LILVRVYELGIVLIFTDSYLQWRTIYSEISSLQSKIEQVIVERKVELTPFTYRGDEVGWGRQLWYSFDYGQARFVFIDTQTDYADDTGEPFAAG